MRCCGGVNTRAKACLLIAFFAASLVVGCAGPATRNNSLSFQDGQGLSNEQILLRNIIAAAHDRTPTFVAANSVTSQAKMDARLSATFTIPDIGHVLAPQLGGAREQSVSILDYGATKAAQHLYKELPEGIARQLLVQGWPSRLMETVLWAGVSIDPALYDLIRLKAERACELANSRGEAELCRWNNEMVRRCGEPHYQIANHAQDACSFIRFQVLLDWLDLSGSHIRVADIPSKDKDGKVVTNQEFREFFDDPEIESLFDRLNAQRDQGDPSAFRHLLRSPAQIIEFLGRLAAMQLYRDPPVVAQVPILETDELEWMVPFRVVRGSDLQGPSAVSARIGGTIYHVPEPYPLSPLRDQSVRVMSLVIELQNRARQEAPIQGSAIAILQ